MFNIIQLAKGFGAVTAGAAGAVYWKSSQHQHPNNIKKLRADEMAVAISMEIEDLRSRTSQRQAFLDWKNLAPLPDEYPAKKPKVEGNNNMTILNLVQKEFKMQTEKLKKKPYTFAEFLAAYDIELRDLEITPKEYYEYQRWLGWIIRRMRF